MGVLFFHGGMFFLPEMRKSVVVGGRVWYNKISKNVQQVKL